jgi:DNA-binding SARP family transcriptional activator/predicted ATPase
MQRLSLNFLGGYEVAAANKQISAFRTDKVRALLAYLALEGARPQRRQRLAAFFWPESDHETALYNFRLTLHRLRQTIDAVAPGLTEPLFSITRSDIEFHIAVAEVDVLCFQQLLADCETHAHEDLYRCAACLARLQQAAALYRGELLAGFGLADAPAFEEWLLLRRETLHHLALLTLHHLAAAAETQGQLEQALVYAQRKLALDPYREETHQQVIRLFARSGLISQALAQYETCRRLLREEVGVEPDAETVALAAQIRSGKFEKAISEQGVESKEQRADEQSKIQNPKSKINPPHNLPAQLTPFVGREREVGELIQRLQDPGVRLLTLAGAGGMGKTRLALAAAQAILDLGFGISDLEPPMDNPQSKIANSKFPDGLFFVSLAPLSRASELTLAVADVLQLQLQGVDPQEALCNVLRGKALLLILDNFEHLLPPWPPSEGAATDAAAIQLVVEILQRAPAVKILVTSRQRLNVRGEHVYKVEGLAHPTDAPLAEAASAPAVQLLRQSVRQVEADFALSEANLPQALRICRLVQGMPLGIEMAAAWADRLSLTTIADQIAQSADFLAADWADAPPRQRSMRAVFDWSWQLLNDAEQCVLRQLAVFRGGFTLDAAVSVAGASVRVLTSLVQKSLLRHAEGRYELHELLRQFAEEQLDAVAEERTAVEARHSDYYLAFVAMRQRRLARQEPRQATDEIKVELANIRQAWTWAAAHTAAERAVTLRGVQFAASAYSLWQFYLITGLYAEGEAALRQAVEGIQAECKALEATLTSQTGSQSTSSGAGDGDEAALRYWQRLLSVLLAFEAYLLANHGKYRMAQTVGEQAVALSVAYGSPEGELMGLAALAQAHYHEGQAEEAERRARQVLQRIEQFSWPGDPPECVCDAQIAAHLYLGVMARNADQDAQARTHLSQVLTLCQPLGKARGMMHARLNLANLARYKQNYVAARQDYEEVLQIAAELGYRRGEAITLYELADVVRGLGEYSFALEQIARARTIAGEIGEPFLENYAQSDLGRLYTYLGDYARAGELVQQALAHHEHFALPDVMQDAWLAAALYYHHVGDDEEALHYATRCQQHAQAHNSRRYTAIAAIHMGYAWEGLGDWDAARQSYQAAVDLYQALDIQPARIEAQAGLARVQLAQGEQAAASRWVDDILPRLAAQASVGMDEPFLVYLTCYQVLVANRDVRATTVLQQGYDLLQQYAARIQEDALRRSFLQNVPVHRALQIEYADRRSSNNTDQGSVRYTDP